MESVTIGEKVESIGESAFAKCNSLTAVTSKAVTPPQIWATTFDDYAMTLYVPAGCKSKYAEAILAQFHRHSGDRRNPAHDYGQCHRRDDGICDGRRRVSVAEARRPLSPYLSGRTISCDGTMAIPTIPAR